MKLLGLFLALTWFSSAALSAQCRSVATRTENGVNTQSETIVSPSEDLGPDVIYEGGNCPAGKICVETMFVTNPGRTFGVSAVQGQVIVLNKEDGSVSELVTLRFRDGVGDASVPLQERGIPLFNSARWLSVCQTMENEEREYARLVGRQIESLSSDGVSATVSIRPERQQRINFCRGQSGGEEFRNSPPYIDLYRYSTAQYLRSRSGPEVYNTRYAGRRQGRSASIIGGVYNSFLPNTRNRMVNFLNAGTSNNTDGAVVQTRSETYMGNCESLTDRICPDGDLPGGGGTFATLVSTVARARAVLGCSVVSDPQARLTRALRNSRGTIEEACGFEYSPSRRVIRDRRSRRDFDLDKGSCTSSFGATERISCVQYTDANRLTTRRSVTFELQGDQVVGVNFPEITPGGLPGAAAYAAYLGVPNREEPTRPAVNCSIQTNRGSRGSGTTSGTPTSPSSSPTSSSPVGTGN
jgi:hypothetical protein